MKGRKSLPPLREKCLGGNYADLSSDECHRYRLALITGRPELFDNPALLDEERQNKFESYFNTCASGAAISAVPAALAGPVAAGTSGAAGCAQSLAARALKENTSIDPRYIDAADKLFNVGQGGYYVVKYGSKAAKNTFRSARQFF